MSADSVSLNGVEVNRGVSTDQVQNAQLFGVDAMDSQCKRDGSTNQVNEHVFLDEFSLVNVSSNRDYGLLDNSGILPNNFLSCLASTLPSIEKRRSSSTSPPNASKKAPTKTSNKWREGHGNANLGEL